MGSAFQTGQYTNLFAEAGHTEEEIRRKLEETFQTMFLGPEELRIYHDAGEDMGYLVDTGNIDVRTEGQSYGMMMAVQMGRKDLFDRIWKWTRTYMYQAEGPFKGYFGWSARLDGTLNSTGPAPDGEEFFAMALLFASNRWGDGSGIFNYSSEAKAILREMVHKVQDGEDLAMFDPHRKLIRFVPGSGFSDPSYHLPHFYELFALWGNPEDAEFFREAARASRKYLQTACHPVTGLAAEYAEFDGTPHNQKNHHHFYSDSYRVAANIGLDFEWFGADAWQQQGAANIQRFFSETAKGKEGLVYDIDGTPVTDPAELVHEVDGTPRGVLHPVGLLAANAQASLASNGKYRLEMVERFWDTPLQTGKRRYYDNCLYLFAVLALSGNYRIWKP